MLGFPFVAWMKWRPARWRSSDKTDRLLIFAVPALLPLALSR
jgi:hypothetical protein